MVDIATARALALALPEAEEADHMGHPAFRVRKKIFATLWPDERRLVLKLTPADQAALSALSPASFAPVSGTWGDYGWTNVQLTAITHSELEDALLSAWRQVAPKRLIAIHNANPPNT